jgi:hypothetical protein
MSMRSTVPGAALTRPDDSPVIPRPKMAKATVPDNEGQHPLSGLVSDAAKATHGKQGAAAAALGKDEGNFARDLRAGRITLRDLYALGPTFLAAFGAELTGQFGALTDPRERARRLCDEMQAIVTELRQYLDHAA